jgi:hypothetical protein
MSRACVLLTFASTLACADREGSHPADSTTATDSGALVRGPAVDSGAPRLEPRDEANASFRAFRERLLAALARRDTAFLHGIVAPEIRTNFGADGGIEDFKSMWKTADASSEVWATLDRLLRMGGKHSSDSMFYAPYVYAFWPDSIDAFSHVAVTGANVAVRSDRQSRSPVLGTASHSIFKAAEWTGIPGDVIASDTSWVRVELPDKRSGWLSVGDVYSPVSWRTAFARRGDQWVMILLVAGD